LLIQKKGIKDLEYR